jgi:hypothetical protein
MPGGGYALPGLLASSGTIFPKYFTLQQGGNAANPRELTSVSDWGERGGQRRCGLKYDGEKKAPVEIAGAWYKQASYWAT